MNNIWKYIISFGVGVGLTLAVMLNIGSGSHGTLTKTDTLIVDRYNTEVKKDTVIKWYEKVTYQQSEPVVVYSNTVDSVFIVKIQELEVMISVKKTGNELYIYAVDQNKRILKEYVYKDVGQNFTATSQEGNVFVKSQIWYWNQVNLSFEHKRPINDLKSSESLIDLTSGINFKNKYSLDAGIEYNTNEGFKLKAKATIKLF